MTRPSLWLLPRFTTTVRGSKSERQGLGIRDWGLGTGQRLSCCSAFILRYTSPLTLFLSSFDVHPSSFRIHHSDVLACIAYGPEMARERYIKIPAELRR